jgi:ATP-binding cassette, subfamily B, bacterial
MKSYTFQYDLGPDMHPADGRLLLDDSGIITSRIGDMILFTRSYRDVDEAFVIPGVGCGLLVARMKDHCEQVLCRFSMSGIKPAGEFCKLVNYCTHTGECVIPEEEEKPFCSKCKRPFMEGMNVCLFCYDKISVIKRALGLMRPFAGKIIPAELLMALSSVLYLLVPLFSRILIDEHLKPMTGTFQQILILTGAMLMARIIGEVIFILSSRVYNKAAIHFAVHLRNIVYAKIQKISMNSLSKRTPGDLIRRVMEDTENVKNFISDGGRWAVEQLIMSVIVLAILLLTNARLTLLVFLPIPIVSIVLTRFWKLIHLRYERQWRKHSACQSILHDIIKGIRTVKSFGKEEVEIGKFARATKNLAQVSSDNETLWARLFPLVTFFTGIGEFLVLYFGGRAILGDQLSFGVLVQFTMYIAYLYAPLRWLVSFPRWLADALTSLVKLFEILDEEPDIRNVDEPNNVPVGGSVSFSSVSFGYKSYEPVLKEINFKIYSGEMVGIVGRSGAGKSTMINLLMRLYDPDQGSVSINETDIRQMSVEHLHQNIGVVFQDTFLFSGTIFENIAYAKPGVSPDEVFAAAKAANAHDFIMQTADGYNTLIGENGHSISGGERQRLAIARAVIKNPKLLILDEATSSLDVETESLIQDGLDRLTKGRTTIAIAHRLSTLRKADRLIVLEKGKIAEFGTHIELLKQKGIYYNLVMAQRQTSKLAAE